MSYFDQAFEDLIDIEGGYTIDRGGKTRYGVTEKVARAYGYKGDMKDLPLDFAKSVYKESYWDKGFEQLSYAVAFQLFDAGVNSGMETAVKWFQTVVGTTPDGIMGPKTIAASKFLSDSFIILRFNALRLNFLTNLSNWSREGKGWVRRVAKNMLMG